MSTQINTLVICIGPPQSGKSTHICEMFDGKYNCLIVEENEIDQNFNEIIDVVNKYEFEYIVIDGLNNEEEHRNKLIRKIKNNINIINIKYMLFDIDKHKLLYDFYVKNNYNVLPIYMYYDYLNIKNINNIDVIKLNSEYDDEFQFGMNAIIVDFKCLFLNINDNKIIVDIPYDLSLIRPNNKLLNFLHKMKDVNYKFYIKYTSNEEYGTIDLFKIYKMLHMINLSKFNLDLGGIEINLNNNNFIESKPNPHKLFEYLKNYGICPHKSIFIGCSNIDKIYSTNAGINKYINGNDFKVFDNILI